MAACTQGIGSAHAKREARSSQGNSDKSSLVHCKATLEVYLTFCAVEYFCYKNIHFVVLSFFSVGHNSLTKACKNTEKSPQFSIFHKDVSPQFSIFHKDVSFDTQTLGYYFTGYGSKLTQRSIHDAIFIPHDQVLPAPR